MSDIFTVKPLKTEKTDLPQSKFMKHNIIARFPSLHLVVGKSGSGKSTVVNHMVTNKDFMGGFFHYVIMFSPTADKDDLVKHLKLPKGNLITDPSSDKLKQIIEKQDEKIKKKGIKWVGENSRVLLIFDDIVSHKKFLESPEMLKLATMGRHSLISSIINTQSYTKVPRAVRLQANGIIVFPSSQNEVNLIVDDNTPPHNTKQQFRELVEIATSGKHSFLYILPMQPVEKRFRKNFGSYLRIADSK